MNPGSNGTLSGGIHTPIVNKFKSNITSSLKSLKNLNEHENISSDDEIKNSEHNVEFDEDDNLSLSDLSDSSDFEEEKISGEEDVKDYKKGGYHPTYIGETYGDLNQYRIIRKLGWGYFSTVWLAYDSINLRHVAIKIVRSSKNYREAAIDEIKILERIAKGPDDHPGKDKIVKLLDHFIHKGPNGEHICMVFEVLGENMLSLLIRYKIFQREKTDELSNTRANSINYSLTDLAVLKESYGGLPLTLVKQITKQVLLALDFLHRYCGLVHTDLKPENIMVEISDVEKLVRLLEREEKNHRIQKFLEKREQKKNNPSILEQRSRSSTKLPVKNGLHLRHQSHSSHSSHSHIRSQSINSPIRCSKPLTSPISNNSSFDTFFRSFSFKQRNSSVSSSQFSSQNNNNNTRHSLSSESATRMKHSNSVASEVNPLDTSNLEVLAEEESEDDDDSQLYVDASEDVNPYSSTTNRILNLHIDTENVASNIGEQHEQNDYHEQEIDEHDEIPPPRFSTVSNSSLTDMDSIISVKLADLGNACYTNLHFTNDIQTRQYRSPEVILGGKWGCSTDIWSVGCLVFELITGDYLFDPKQGSSYTKDDDHLAQIIELLNYYPSKEFLKKCKYSKVFFDKATLSYLKNISKLKIWKLNAVLMDKYHINKELAQEITEFLLHFLEFEPKKRWDAGSLSNHPFLDDVSGINGITGIDRRLGLKGQDIQGWLSETED